MDRQSALARLTGRTEPWDIAVIGGGATGVGIALDAAARGYSVCLFEQSDFGKATSSRSTKLVHGGVRYLQKGNISLVMEALKERGILRQNAPHLVHDLAFVVPNYVWWEAPFYGIGMKVYDALAGRYGFGRSRLLSKDEVLQHIPTLETQGLRGGVLYYDGQFDDSRLLINLAQTADEQGAVLLNYAPVVRIEHDADGFINALVWTDAESPGIEHTVRARSVINATGAFVDRVRRIDNPNAAPMISPSQGAHIVLDRSFLPGDAAIMVPRTSDGRVMFAIPWHGHTLVGTTDTPVDEAPLEPVAFEQEIDFILETAAHYLARPPRREDTRSAFAGIRPLVKSSGGSTAVLSREHAIHVENSGLISIAGGKWTTYRKMAEDCVDHAAMLAKLDERPSVTKTLPIHGCHPQAAQFGDLHGYGTDAPAIRELMASDPRMARPLHATFPICAAQVAWAVRHEMARTLDDVLARRTRVLFLDVAAALAMAPDVAAIMAAELGRDVAWQTDQLQTFRSIARGYQVHPPLTKE